MMFSVDVVSHALEVKKLNVAHHIKSNNRIGASGVHPPVFEHGGGKFLGCWRSAYAKSRDIPIPGTCLALNCIFFDDSRSISILLVKEEEKVVLRDDGDLQIIATLCRRRSWTLANDVFSRCRTILAQRMVWQTVRAI